jgi:hypothetical protein
MAKELSNLQHYEKLLKSLKETPQELRHAYHLRLINITSQQINALKEIERIDATPNE